MRRADWTGKSWTDRGFASISQSRNVHTHQHLASISVDRINPHAVEVVIVDMEVVEMEVATGVVGMEVVIEVEVVIVAAVVMAEVGTARDVLDPDLAADLLTTEIGIEIF